MRGFTLLELLLVLFILASVLALVWPRLRVGVPGRAKARFLYGIVSLATQAWREAQLDCRTMHIMFDRSQGGATWIEGNSTIPFPPGYRLLGDVCWEFLPDAPPHNRSVRLVRGADTLLVRSRLNRAMGFS